MLCRRRRRAGGEGWRCWTVRGTCAFARADDPVRKLCRTPQKTEGKGAKAALLDSLGDLRFYTRSGLAEQRRNEVELGALGPHSIADVEGGLRRRSIQVPYTFLIRSNIEGYYVTGATTLAAALLSYHLFVGSCWDTNLRMLFPTKFAFHPSPALWCVSFVTAALVWRATTSAVTVPLAARSRHLGGCSSDCSPKAILSAGVHQETCSEVTQPESARACSHLQVADAHKRMESSQADLHDLRDDLVRLGCAANSPQTKAAASSLQQRCVSCICVLRDVSYALPPHAYHLHPSMPEQETNSPLQHLSLSTRSHSLHDGLQQYRHAYLQAGREHLPRGDGGGSTAQPQAEEGCRGVEGGGGRGRARLQPHRRKRPSRTASFIASKPNVGGPAPRRAHEGVADEVTHDYLPA